VKGALGFSPGRCLLLTMLLTLALYARDRAARGLDPGYGSALAAADHFLQAWQAGDAESGTALLSSRAKEKATPEALDQFFTADAPAKARAYAVGRGKMLKGGRYEFPVMLIGGASQSGHARRRFSSIILVNTGHNDWAVDKLP
jgi:hypothetical protein